MYMINCLARCLAVVYPVVETVRRKAFPDNPGDHYQARPHVLILSGSQIQKRGHVTPGDNQSMTRRHGIGVVHAITMLMAANGLAVINAKWTIILALGHNPALHATLAPGQSALAGVTSQAWRSPIQAAD
jgi:hypothetical protein